MIQTAVIVERHQRLQVRGAEFAYAKVMPGRLGRPVHDPLVRESVQDTFVDIFFKYTNAKPLKGDSGDIVIVGVLTVEEGSTGVSKGKMSGAGSSTFAAIGGSSSGASAAGNYVSGMTFQVYKNGEMIATYSVGQNLGGGQLVSPVALGTTAAYYLSSALIRKNEIGRP